MAFDGYNGGPLMNPLACIQAAEADYTGNSTNGFDGGADIPDDSPDWCHSCDGKGGSIERQDPVGDGVGFETFLNACPDCLGAGKCPWCGSAVDAEYYCQSKHCSFGPENIDEPGSFEDYDYPDDDPGFDPMFLM